MSEARALLPAGVGRDEVDEAADALGWRLVNVLPRDEGRPRQIYFAAADGTGLVALVEDHRIDARYLVAQGHDAEGLLRRAVAHTGELDRDAVLAMLPTERVRALAWLGIARATGRTEEVTQILAEAEADDDENVRAAASFAREALRA